MMKRFLTFTMGMFPLLVGTTALAQQTVNYASLGGLVVDPAGEAVEGAFVSARVLRDLNLMIANANPRHEDIPEAIAKSGVKMTSTPCVLLKSGELRTQLAK